MQKRYLVWFIVAVYIHLTWLVGTPQKRGLLRKFEYIIKKDPADMVLIFTYHSPR